MSFFVIQTIKGKVFPENCFLRKCYPSYYRLFSKTNDNNRETCSKRYELRMKYRERRKELKTRIMNNLKETKLKMEEFVERENIWTVPNFLCIGRILCTPWLGYLIVSEDYQLALWVLGFAGVSDLADGWIARTWTSQSSKLGSILDPAADKLLVGTLFLSLSWVGLIPIALTCLIVGRDMALVGAASYIRYKSLPSPKTLARYFDPTHATVQLAPTFISKLNTAVQLCLVGGTLAAPVFNFIDHPVLQGLWYFTALTTIAGGLSYIFKKDTYKILSKKKRNL